MRMSSRLLPMMALLLSSVAVADAQTKPNAAPPVSPDPSITTASFGDWTLRCEKPRPDLAQRICEVVQTVQRQAQSSAVAQIAFGRSTSNDPIRLVVVVPVNVLFPSPVTMGSGDKTSPSLELAWRRCLPVGCFAENTAPDAAIGQWRQNTGRGQITYKDAAGRETIVPLSFRGLAQALDALAKQ